MADPHRVVVPMPPELVAAIDALAERAERSRAAQIRWMLLTMTAEDGKPKGSIDFSLMRSQTSDTVKSATHAFKAKSGTLRCAACGVARGLHN